MFLEIVKKYAVAIVVALILLLGTVIGWNIKPDKKCQEVKCPEIARITDTIIKHDTTRVPVYRADIRYSRDTVHDTIAGAPLAYQENCFTIKDSVHGSSATMCSKEFPPYKPVDLHGDIVTARPPDTQRTIRYVDTVRVNPKYKWFAVSVGPYCGYGVDKNFNIGVGLSLGLKIKEF
jgi:hypothetical protein